VRDDDIGGWGSPAGRLCKNFHPSPTNPTRHSRHTGHNTANLQVTALIDDFAGALQYFLPDGCLKKG